MNRKNWLLLTIAAAGGDTLSPVQLQKSMFLLGEKERKEVGKGFYKFVPYAYGPFCVDLYRDAEELESKGLVSIHQIMSGRWKEYRVTPEGSEKAEKIRTKVNEQAFNTLVDTVDHVRALSFNELLREVYRDYPYYSKKSVFQD